MFCIAAFIVLGIMSIFSASQRKLAKSAWHCVTRRATFRPCDSSFKEELKAKLLARTMIKKPRLAKFLDAAIEVLAVIFVVATIWSLYVALKSGLNLYVYGTCNPRNASSCSLGAEACSIDSERMSFVQSLKKAQPHTWLITELEDFLNTIDALPSRVQEWKAEDYLPANASYYSEFDSAKPTALEIIDPGCQFCAQLMHNIKNADFKDRYNLTYIAYPIKSESGFKFKNSEVITRYLEAVRRNPLTNVDTPVDWQILDRIFTGKDNENTPYQTKINALLDNNQTEELMKQWLKEFGYNAEQIQTIETDSKSQAVTDIIEANRELVNERINTVKIPTIIFDGRRHDGVVDTEKLQ